MSSSTSCLLIITDETINKKNIFLGKLLLENTMFSITFAVVTALTQHCLTCRLWRTTVDSTSTTQTSPQRLLRVF